MGIFFNAIEIKTDDKKCSSFIGFSDREKVYHLLTNLHGKV